MSHHLKLSPRDPIIVRDGRPFGNAAGQRMKSLDWPYPSVLAGSLRTLLGKAKGGFSEETVNSLKQIEIGGPLPLRNKQLYFPAPKDGIVYEKNNRREFMRLWPVQTVGGCDMPDGLTPVSVTDDVKPVDAPAFWSTSVMTTWLTGDKPPVPPVSEKMGPDSSYLNAPEKEERTHAAIEADSGAAADGMLFTTVGLDLGSDLELAARVNAGSDWEGRLNNLNGLHPFGGERRLVHWQLGDEKAWECPPTLQDKLEQASLIRLVLATPAIFKQGWRPAWLTKSGDHWQGTPPCCPGLTLQLESACVDRWQPISGWSLERRSWGPKPVRRLVAAGSVYFFKVISGDTAALAKNECWLRSVCDDEQDRRDGFGLALWGIWNNIEGKNK